MPSAHVYGHHQFGHQGGGGGGGDSTWMHQQQHHPQQGGAASAQQQQQSQSQQQQQQQHYGRLASNQSNAGNMGGQDGGGHEHISEDNRRTMAYIADLLNENTREAALLELSKKREQVPELALILWHSFGTTIRLSLLGLLGPYISQYANTLLL